MITIDGSQGEGGGQIVRSSLALSLVPGEPIALENIRAGRRKPGLMRQHLTAVEAATKIGAAQITGAEIGSSRLSFVPQSILPGEHTFRVGTAGSATLVLQTILPALIMAEGPSTIRLEGGTHNPWAPPFDFLAKAFLPLLARMGPRVEARMERYGFYPKGGGEICINIQPSPKLAGFDLLDRGPQKSHRVWAIVAGLPRHIGERECRTIAKKMGWDESDFQVEQADASCGPGNVVMVELASQRVTELFIGFGRRGIKAEDVAKRVAKDAREYLAAEVPVGPYLADQIMLPLGLSAHAGGGGGAFRTMALTPHASTHLEILQQFLDVKVDVTQDDRNRCQVRIGTAI